LKGNYEALGTWPLAINAYNAGATRMKRAVKQVGTTDISKIIHNYQHPSYSFASRNFYPEYLAAHYVFENYKKLFGNLPVKAPLEFDLATFPKSLGLKQVAALLQITTEELQNLNPSLSQTLFNQDKIFPAGTSLRVPSGTGLYFASLVEKMEIDSAPKVAAGKWHVVSVGDTLWSISKQYAVDVSEIKKLNQLPTNQIQVGNRIRIPPSPSFARY